MNLNYSHKADYALRKSLVYEAIRTYGIPLTFIYTDKLNRDTIFGDYSHLKDSSVPKKTFYGLPENAENFDSDYMFNQFGIQDFSNITINVSTVDFDESHINLDITKIVGNIVVLPSGKVMEISDCDWYVGGTSNLFAFDDAKSVYKLTLIPYEFKVQDELTNLDSLPSEAFDSEFKDAADIKPLEETQKYMDKVEAVTRDTSKFDELLRELDNTVKTDTLDKYFENLIKVKDDVKEEMTELSGLTAKSTTPEDTVKTKVQEVREPVPPKPKVPEQKVLEQPSLPQRRRSKFTGF